MADRPSHPDDRPNRFPSRRGPAPTTAAPAPRGKRPPLTIQLTTLWDYPSQDYGDGRQGVPGYKGATPSYIVWNLLQRYTAPKELVVDCFAGSGTTLGRGPRPRPQGAGVRRPPGPP